MINIDALFAALPQRQDGRKVLQKRGGKRPGKRCGGSYIAAEKKCRVNETITPTGKRKLTEAGKESARELAVKVRERKGLPPIRENKERAKERKRSKTKLPSDVEKLEMKFKDGFVATSYDFSVGGRDVQVYFSRKPNESSTDVLFSVGNDISRKGGKTLSSRDRAVAAVKIAQIFKHDTETRPEGHKYRCSASTSDGEGAYRAYAYTKMGFSPPARGTPGSKQFAMVHNGKTVPDLEAMKREIEGGWMTSDQAASEWQNQLSGLKASRENTRRAKQ